MAIVRFAVLGWFVAACAGCGVRFTEEALNKKLPEDFTHRNLYTPTDIMKYHLDELAGSILYRMPNETEYRRVERIAAKEVHVEPIKAQVLYNSKVTNGASVQGSYLAFTADMKFDQVAEVTIQDTAQAFIPWNDVPADSLKVEKTKPLPPGARRYYVQGALLATIDKEYFHEISANASGQIGNTTGVGGKVYNSDKEIIRDFKISLLLVDIDAVDWSLRSKVPVGLVQDLRVHDVADKGRP